MEGDPVRSRRRNRNGFFVFVFVGVVFGVSWWGEG